MEIAPVVDYKPTHRSCGGGLAERKRWDFGTQRRERHVDLTLSPYLAHERNEKAIDLSRQRQCLFRAVAFICYVHKRATVY